MQYARVLLGLTCLPLVGCISTGEREMEVTPPRTLSTQVGQVLSLEFPSGDINVTPSKDASLHASVSFYCDPDSKACLANAERARIVHEQQGQSSILRFKPGSAYSTRHANLVFNVQIPVVEQLNVEADAGDIEITSPTACVTVRAGAGDLLIAVPAASIKSADLDANVGDANLQTATGYVDDKRTMLVGSEVKWNAGPGSCELRAKLQAGAINARLLESP